MTASCREKLWKAADQLELSPFEKNATKVSLNGKIKSSSSLSFRIRMGGVKSPDLLWFEGEERGLKGYARIGVACQRASGDDIFEEGETMGPEAAGRDGILSEGFHIVEAQVRDAPVLANFWERLMAEEAPPLFHAGADGGIRAERAFRRMLAQPGGYRGYLLVPGSPGEIAPDASAGFILGSVYERLYGTPSRAGNIMHWYVVPSARGRGQGERLYQALLEWFRKEEAETVEVMARTEASRTAAWRRRGFSEVLSLLVMPAPWKEV